MICSLRMISHLRLYVLLIEGADRHLSGVWNILMRQQVSHLSKCPYQLESLRTPGNIHEVCIFALAIRSHSLSVAASAAETLHVIALYYKALYISTIILQ